eukprot:sb/3478608/
MAEPTEVDKAITHSEYKFIYEDSSLTRNPAFLEYSQKDGTLDMLHTFVPPAMRGKGVAGALVKVGLKFAASNKLSVRLTCWYTADFVKKFGSLGCKIAK